MNGKPHGRPWRLVQRPGRPAGPRFLPPAVWIAVCIAAVVTGRAADDTVLNDDPRISRPDEQQHWLVLDQQIDGMFFGNHGGNEKAALQQLSSRARLQLAAVDVACGLTERQRRKGEAAVAIGVAQTVADVGALRRRYAGRMLDMRKPEEQAQWQRLHQDAQAVQATILGDGGTAKLLSGVITTMLDDEQRSRWQREVEARERSRLKRVVDEGLAVLEVQLGLTTAQRDALAAMLEETPLRIDEDRGRVNFGPGGLTTIVRGYALSLVDQERLRAIVNDRQWAVLSQVMTTGKAMAPQLKQQKIILD